MTKKVTKKFIRKTINQMKKDAGIKRNSYTNDNFDRVDDYMSHSEDIRGILGQLHYMIIHDYLNAVDESLFTFSTDAFMERYGAIEQQKCHRFLAERGYSEYQALANQVA